MPLEAPTSGDGSSAPLDHLSITGRTELRTLFEPLVPDVLHVSNTNRYHRPADRMAAAT